MATEKPFEFDKALTELEEITAWFESGNIDLDAGLAKFERGMTLAGQLKAHLATVENRIEKIKRRFGPDGTATDGEGESGAPTEPNSVEASSTPAEPEPTVDQTGLF